MAYTLTSDPDDDVLGWSVFVDRRPVTDFNRDFEAVLKLEPGKHRLVVDCRGAGSTIKVTVDGNAALVSPAGGWPLTVKVPNTETVEIVVAEFTTI